MMSLLPPILFTLRPLQTALCLILQRKCSCYCNNALRDYKSKGNICPHVSWTQNSRNTEWHWENGSCNIPATILPVPSLSADGDSPFSLASNIDISQSSAG